ncbi:MAG: hypothetical protein ACOYXT_13120 [Bacteroidota bacterium]
MKKILLLISLFISSTVGICQTHTLQEYYNQAKEAYQAGDHTKFYEMITSAHKLHPYHQTILYQAGLASALTGRSDEAVAYLKKATQIKADFDLDHGDLKSLGDREDFKRLKQLQAEWQQPVRNSDTAFVIKDRTLHIESIAPGEKGTFYLGSIHKRKIIRVNEKGEAKDFTASAQDGLTSVFGVKVDLKNNILWACASPMEEMEHYDTNAVSGVYKYNLKTGKLIAKYVPTDIKKNFVFGDLTLNNKGEVFVSDSKNNIIFKVNEVNSKLEEYFTSEEFWNLQGITFTPDGKFLFIADYIKGIYRLDTKSKNLIKLDEDFEVSTKSVDGLTFYHNGLIAIQNAIVPMRVTRYMLNKSQDNLESYVLIDRAHPAFNEPTIGCISGDSFYYVANSLWSGYTEQHQLKPLDELQDVVILKTDLKKFQR